MFGNFCSCNCAASYIFDSNDNSDEIWEKFSLLNSLYLGNNIETIKLAPSKLCLKKFGGKLSIEDFRNLSLNSSKDYKIIMPPMISLIPTLEEVNLDITKKKNFVPLDSDKLQQVNTEFKLKRSKPLPEFKNTLENCMHLKYV